MSTNHLPAQPTHFVGREKELTKIAALLADPACRLLTLAGPGGIGKTRLAIEAGRQIAAAYDICFVAFQPVTSPDFMVSAVADAVGCQFGQGSEPRQQLLDFFRDKSLLLVLDNLEHLLDGVNLLSDILAAAPDVEMLVTSRERLNLVEEWVLDIGGMTCPPNDLDTPIGDYDAVRLFVQQAQRTQGNFTLTDKQKPAITRICHLLGGMPLGIELAAGWVRVLNCEQIADEIENSLDILESPARNVEPRHRTMRAAFEPTWRRLSEEERGIFKRLSVFRGGFTRKAAEYVAGASLRTLSLLLDRSLLRVDTDGRYDIHELLRQYAQEQLHQSSEETGQTHDRHCQFYTTFLEGCWPRLTGSDIKSALHEINLELDNIRAAWEWAVSHRQTREIEAALNSLWLFYDEGSRSHEGEQIFAKAVRDLKPSTPEQEVLWAKVLARHGALVRLVLLHKESNTLLEQSVVLLRQSYARSDLAFALTRLAVVVPGEGKAIQYLQESHAIYTELDDGWGKAQALDWLCGFHINLSFQQDKQANLMLARQYALEHMQICQQIASPEGLAKSYLSLGSVAHCLEEYAQAFAYFRKSLDLFQDVGIFWGILYILRCLGGSACALGEYTDARYYSLRGLEAVSEHHEVYNLQYTCPLLVVVAEIWLGEGQTERAYELLALVDQWRDRIGFSKGYIAFHSLLLLDEELPPHLAAAVARGRGRAADIEIVVQEILYEFRQAVEHSATQSAAAPSATTLSARELEILSLTAEGLNSREVAQRLYLGVTTVRWYQRQIYSKLDAHTRAEALARARELKLLM